MRSSISGAAASGLGIYGGLVGGILAIVIYAMVKKLDILMWLDFIAPTCCWRRPLAAWATGSTRELYGPATDVAWAFHINPAYRLIRGATGLFSSSHAARATCSPITRSRSTGMPTMASIPPSSMRRCGVWLPLRCSTIPSNASNASARRWHLAPLHRLPARPVLGRNVPPRRLGHGQPGHRPVDRNRQRRCGNADPIVRHWGWNWREHPKTVHGLHDGQVVEPEAPAPEPVA